MDIIADQSDLPHPDLASAWTAIKLAESVRERLLAHLRGDNDCIRAQSPTHYVCEVTADAENREREPIVELSPICSSVT